MAGCATCLHKNVHPNVCSDCLGGTHFKPRIKTKTNGDRLRAMTDEELAEWIGKVTAGGYGMCAPGHYDCTGKDSCAPCWLDWLKEKAESEGDDG